MTDAARSELAALYLRVADTLERSAQLAEEHAKRERNTGRRESEGVELDHAKRAREAARRGRALALRLTGNANGDRNGELVQRPDDAAKDLSVPRSNIVGSG